MKTIFFGDSETSTFFEFLGIETRVVENLDQFLDELKRVRKSKSYGLLIVTEDIVAFAREYIDSLRFSKELPLIIDVQSIKGSVKDKINLSDYIREAIGVKI